MWHSLDAQGLLEQGCDLFTRAARALGPVVPKPGGRSRFVLSRLAWTGDLVMRLAERERPDAAGDARVRATWGFG